MAKLSDAFNFPHDRSMSAKDRAVMLREAWAKVQIIGRFDIIDKPLLQDKKGALLAVIISIPAGPVRIPMFRSEVVNLIEVLKGSIYERE